MDSAHAGQRISAPCLRTGEQEHLAEREATLIERQRRVVRRAEWLKGHPEISSSTG